MMMMGSSNRGTTATASYGTTPQLVWKNRADLLAYSREEHDKLFAKLMAGARETEWTAPDPGRDGLHARALSAPPMC